MTHTFADWQRLAASLEIEGRAFVDGAYRDAASGRRFDCVSPIDGRVLAHIADSGAEDVDAAYGVEWFAEAIDKIGGEVAPVDPKLVGLVTREPVGVVAAVVPWNFPLLMAAWKFAPALAA
ncbi:aldehyde dehydrogenase family protein, partial [Burkholderia gladioli]|nr:aldehyde dehydrogenase family protein [Burkholderia gladioli]